MFIKCLFSVLFLFTCGSFTQLSREDVFRKERDKKIYTALRKFKNAMEAKGYRAAGLGEGIDHSTGKQNYLGVTFTIERLPDINIARKIEVTALQDFLNYINAEEGIQDYVAEYPYPLKFVRIAFISQHRNKGLFSVANYQEEIYYNQDMPDKPMGPSEEVHSESYEDALRILNQI